MRIAIFGATGRTGSRIVEAARAAGHEAIPVARRGEGRRVDLSDPATIAEAVRDADAVISALASGKGNPACSRLATALADRAGLRFVSIGGAGVDAPGDAKALPDRVVGWIMRRVVPEMLADRQRELAILERSALVWTMLRPPRLTDGAAGGAPKLTFDTPAATAITRADLARAAIAALDDPGLERRAPFVSG